MKIVSQASFSVSGLVRPRQCVVGPKVSPARLSPGHSSPRRLPAQCRALSTSAADFSPLFDIAQELPNSELQQTALVIGGFAAGMLIGLWESMDARPPLAGKQASPYVALYAQHSHIGLQRHCTEPMQSLVRKPSLFFTQVPGHCQP